MRSCEFRNLYLRLEDRQWVYFQHQDDPPRIKVAGQQSGSTNFSAANSQQEERFFIQDTFIEWAAHHKIQDKVAVTPHVHNGAPPSSSSLVYDVSGVSILWDFTGNSEYSYGHCLLNDWYPMFLTLSTHKESHPRQFKIFSHNPTPTNTKGSHTCLHYTSAWSNSHVRSLATLVEKAKAGGHQWVRFCDLIIGSGGYSKTAAELVHCSNALPDSPSLFNSINWRSLRNAVYRGFDVALPGAGVENSSRRQSVLILARPEGDTRECTVPQSVPASSSDIKFAYHKIVQDVLLLFEWLAEVTTFTHATPYAVHHLHRAPQFWGLICMEKVQGG